MRSTAHPHPRRACCVRRGRGMDAPRQATPPAGRHPANPGHHPGLTNHDSTDLSGTVYSGDTLTLVPGTRYILYGQLFVNDGGLLVVEPGVTVIARRIRFSALADQAPTIIVRQGGRIIANGTAGCPSPSPPRRTMSSTIALQSSVPTHHRARRRAGLPRQVGGHCPSRPRTSRRASQIA